MPPKTKMEPRKGVMRGTSVRKSVLETRKIIDEQAVCSFRNKIDVLEVMKENIGQNLISNTSFGPPLDQIRRQKVPHTPITETVTTPIGLKLAKRRPRPCTELVNRIAIVELPKRRERRGRKKQKITKEANNNGEEVEIIQLDDG